MTQNNLPLIYLLGNALSPYAPKLYRQAEDALRAAGYTVVNPVGATPVGGTRKYLSDAIAQMLLSCDAVAALPGWDRTDIGVAEEKAARASGLDIRPFREWIEQER